MVKRGRWAAVVAALAATIAVNGAVTGNPGPAEGAAVVPAGFSVEQVVSMNGVIMTNFAFAPDGRIFIADKAGRVLVAQGGSILPTPFIDISTDVNNYWEHGLTGLALDPQFPTRPYVYVLYVYDPPGMAKDVDAKRFARIERITANTANTNVAATTTGSRVVLFGGAASAATLTTTACTVNSQPVEDCIPVDSFRHAAGDLRFGPDGALYAAMGDGDRIPNGPQDPRIMAGKIFRINPDTGRGYADNPFYNGNLDANVSKVFSLGHRNPWRISFHPTSGEMLIGDVGETTWEVIYRGVKGMNYGWPCREAGTQPYGAFSSSTTCQTYYANATPVVPAYQYNHNGLRSSVTGGVWYTGTSYPAAYQNAFFWGDYGRGTLEVLKRNGAGYTNEAFGNGFGGNSIVSFANGPGGDVYLMTIGGFNTNSISGTIWRLRYTAAGNRPPVAVISTNTSQGSAPLAVTFTGTGSTDPDGNALTYAWNFGDGGTSTAANPTHTFAANGSYDVTLVVRDTAGATNSATVTIKVGPVPVVTITSPEPGSLVSIGELATFTATATDPVAGNVSSAIRWSSRLYHAGHLHPDPVLPATGPTVSFTVADHDDDIRYELCATVTNSAGISSNEVCRSVSVRMSQARVETVPTGLTVTLGGLTQPAPFTADINTGGTRILAAAPTLGCYQFTGWSDGGAATHDVVVSGPVTYTATYAAIPNCTTGGELRVSDVSSRAGSIPLSGATLPQTGNRYFFFQTAQAFTRVQFWLDNPGMTGTPWRSEGAAPWDFNGGGDATANPFAMSGLSAGTHQISVRATRADGTSITASAAFTVGVTQATTTTTAATTTAPAATTTTGPAATTTTAPAATTTTAPAATTTTAAATTTTGVVPNSGDRLMLSASATRTPAATLDGATLVRGRNHFIFLTTAASYSRVQFWIDNTAMSGTPYRTETLAPWDFNGGGTATAYTYTATGLAVGSHTITARGTTATGATVVTTARFTVA